ncbi:hypothetical protein Hanom_Chr12g01065731 [Helianthus anomalus]
MISSNDICSRSDFCTKNSGFFTFGKSTSKTGLILLVTSDSFRGGFEGNSSKPMSFAIKLDPFDFSSVARDEIESDEVNS